MKRCSKEPTYMTQLNEYGLLEKVDITVYQYRIICKEPNCFQVRYVKPQDKHSSMYCKKHARMYRLRSRSRRAKSGRIRRIAGKINNDIPIPVGWTVRGRLPDFNPATARCLDDSHLSQLIKDMWRAGNYDNTIFIDVEWSSERQQGGHFKCMLICGIDSQNDEFTTRDISDVKRWIKRSFDIVTELSV